MIKRLTKTKQSTKKQPFKNAQHAVTMGCHKTITIAVPLLKTMENLPDYTIYQIVPNVEDLIWFDRLGPMGELFRA